MTSLLLCVLTAPARAGDCARSSDGASVTCTSEGFGLLTREAILARGEVKTCSIKLNESHASIAARDVAIEACEAKFAALPPPPEPPSLMKPLVGYGVGVASTVLLLVGILVPVPDQARLAIGAAGLAGLAGGVVLVVWR
jgi:hypothetical protein